MNELTHTTVVIADDDVAVRGALAELIRARDDLVLIGVADSGDEAADLCARHHPALAVVDVMMPGGGDLAIEAIHRVSPSTDVVVYTALSDRRTRTKMLDAGASLVLIKGAGLDVAEELRRVARREPPNDHPAAPE